MRIFQRRFCVALSSVGVVVGVMAAGSPGQLPQAAAAGGCTPTGGQVIKPNLYRAFGTMGAVCSNGYSGSMSGYLMRNGQVVYRLKTEFRSGRSTYNTPWIAVNPGDRVQMVQTNVTAIPYV